MENTLETVVWLLPMKMSPENEKNKCTNWKACGKWNIQSVSPLNLKLGTSDTNQNKTSLGSKCSDCRALASTMQRCNCACTVLWWVKDAPPSNTPGALSEQTDNQLTPTDAAVYVTSGKLRPQLPRRTIPKPRLCWRQFCVAQEEFLLPSAWSV